MNLSLLVLALVSSGLHTFSVLLLLLGGPNGWLAVPSAPANSCSLPPFPSPTEEDIGADAYFQGQQEQQGGPSGAQHAQHAQQAMDYEMDDLLVLPEGE